MTTAVETRAIACDMIGVTNEQRQRHRDVRAVLLAARREVHRDERNWTVVFEPSVPIAAIAEFVEFERRCCAFLDWDICGRSNGVCLELGGPEGSVEFIGSLFDLVSVPIAS